jgi:copper resistance protein B
MARSRDIMMKDSGGNNFGQVLLNLFEYQARSGRDGYRWDGEGFYGGDINRLWLKSEGEGEFGRGIDSAEVQVLYSRAIDPISIFRAVSARTSARARPHLRDDRRRGPGSCMFEVEGALFLSTRRCSGRVEVYDQRITQRLIAARRGQFRRAGYSGERHRFGAGQHRARRAPALRQPPVRTLHRRFLSAQSRRHGAAVEACGRGRPCHQLRRRRSLLV